jgi:hypothetical protein
MPQSKILSDTNSYLRLANNIRPLLCVEFGGQKYCLYVLPETSAEISNSSRLQHKFHWAMEEEYRQERLTPPVISRKQKKEIQAAYSVIWEHVETEHPGPSRVDAMYLAHGFVMKFPIVTDDRDMRSLANIFEIPTQKTLDLLRIMVDCDHITTATVQSIVAYWKYNQDTPADMQNDLSAIFSEVQFL